MSIRTKKILDPLKKFWICPCPNTLKGVGIYLETYPSIDFLIFLRDKPKDMSPGNSKVYPGDYSIGKKRKFYLRISPDEVSVS